MDKVKSLIEELNKTLTNSLDYKDVLTTLSKSVSQEATRKKLNELAEVKDQESHDLMELIKKLGGHIDPNERMTDQESVCWVPRPTPDGSDRDDMLGKLITSEENAIKEYKTLLDHDEMDSESKTKTTLRKHLEQAEANLEYFQGAINS